MKYLESLEDNFYHFLGAYKKSPDLVKKALSAPFKILPRTYYLGNKFKYFLSEVSSMEYASKKAVEEYQWNRLSNLIQHAYNTVPFYMNKWREYGINISQIQNINDFVSIIPHVTKSDIQNEAKKFVSNIYSNKEMLRLNSGGSTGKPLQLFQLKGYTRSAEWAHMYIQWGRIGFKPGARMARLRGDYIGANKIYSFDPWRNILILSSFGIKAGTFSQYMNLLYKYKIEYINAYPASLFNLIQLSPTKNINIPTLKAIFLGSENILDYQIDHIKKFFGIQNVYYWYGHGESCCLGGICEVSTNYHFFPTYGFTEFVKNESIGENNDNIAEIVGTSFINPLMPLIRYRTEDYGIVQNETCQCGRNHVLLSKIIGREQEMAVGFNNEKITLTALIFGRHSSYFNHIIKMQIVNVKPGELIVKVIPKASFEKKHIEEIKSNLSEKEGMPFKTEVELVEDIRSTSHGKHRFLIREFDEE